MIRRKNKYGAIKTNGLSSKLEACLYELLKARQSAGEISDIRLQQPIVLQPGPRKVKVVWKVDFSFTLNSTGELTYCEAKGVETGTYKIKLKMYRAKADRKRLEIWKGNYRRGMCIPFLAEVIERGEAA